MNISFELIAPASERLAWALIHSLWQGAAVALALGIMLRVLRRHSAAARHAACLLALLTLLTTAIVTAALVSSESTVRKTVAHRIAVTPTSAMPQSPAAGAHAPLRNSFFSSSAIDEPAQVAAIPPLPFSKSWRERLTPTLPWIASLWGLGVLVLSLRHCGGWWRVRSLRRSGAAVDAEIESAFARLIDRFALRRAARLLESAEALTPMLTGVLKPVILLPAHVLTGLGPAEIEAVLAHELAHLVRGDTWTNLAQVIIETVLFYHPAVWWISHRARLEREHAADDLALRVCADRRIYAGALVRLAELDTDPAMALAATGGDLMTRIRRILKPLPPESAPGGLSFSVPVLIASLALAAVFGSRAVADDPKLIPVAPGESIQAAIDKAPAEAVIRLGAGEWKERIVIAKPITIEGAGWEKTIIKPDQPPAGATPEAKAEFRKRYVRDMPEAEVTKLNLEWAEKFEMPTLLVHDTAKVTVRGIRIGGVPPASKDEAGGDTLIVFRKAQGALFECAAVGPFANGIQVTDQSDVEIRQSLVAAMWSEGIVVRGRGRNDTGDPSRLRLIESEVRNVYHYGVAIGPGCDSTVVEHCRISGTAWHGIRYDNASPTITGNVIFQNARSGIYASGKTQAVVRENLFWKNEMDGVSCWFDNADKIESNTFVGNLREGLAVIGGAKPNVARNIFIGNPTAIVCSMTQGRTVAGDPVLSGNLFWDNNVVLQVKEESKSAPEDSVNADPKFRDAAKQDFTPSVAVGATKPLAPAGPWPLLAEERAIIPADDTREFSYWSEPGAPKKSKAVEKVVAESNTDAKPWIDDAYQLENAAKRTAAIERIRAAITSGNVDEARTGITAFVRLGPIEFDKASFRPAVRALLTSQDIPTRSAAASAFTMTGTDPEDLPRIFALADYTAAEVRDNLTYVIVQVMKYDLTGKPASDAILKLMAKLPRDPRNVAHALWGAKFSPEIEARVLEFCRDLQSAGSGAGYNFFYGALSTQANKSEASCKRLIELLAHQDTTNIAGRSAWGLQQGVDRAQYPLVADAMVKVIEARSDGYLRKNALNCLRSYGSSAQAPALKAILAKPGVTGEFRKTLEEVLASIESRPAVNAPETTAAPAAPASSSTTSSSPAAPPAEKAEIEVLWEGKWWPATVLKKDGDRTQIHYVGYASRWDEWVTKERIRPLKESAASDDPARAAAEHAAQLVEKNRRAARIRADQDNQYYSREQLREIETLYQVANTRGKRSEEGKASLKQLLEKYDKANRTGCATLYLGQASEGDERLEYLTRAVEKFSDCFYFNGCQVGGYGRYVLALTLWDRGEKDKARALLSELKTTYKDATDHNGRPMGEVAEAVEKELGR
jgi:beta-lactamase regulating signal transducer with metallopeptidase domain